MHRETLSRSAMFFSHNLMGKSVISFNCPRAVAGAGRVSSLTNRCLEKVHNNKCFHTSLERSARSVTQSIFVEAKDKGVRPPPVVSTSASVSQEQGADKSGMPTRKQFNLSAKDILDTPDDSPPRISREPASSITSRTLLDNRVYNAQTIENLLELSRDPDITLKHACWIISRIGSLAHGRADTQKRVHQDKRFVRVFNLIQRGNHAQFPHTLLQALTGLQKLGLEGSEEVLKLLETELSWSMRRCPLRFLTKAVRMLHEKRVEQSFKGGDPNDKETVLKAAIKVLHRRWIEAISGSDFISLFQIIDLLEDDTKLKLEERTADVAHQFSQVEMMKIFIILGSKKRRPTPLLRALAYHYSKTDQKAPVKDMIELIYALNELTFSDPILMNKLCTDLSADIGNTKKVSQISSLLISLGQMRYMHREILLAIDDWIMKHLHDLRPFDYAAWLQTAAVLNYRSENLQAFCDKADQVLSQSSASSPIEWVNIVHSFVTLNHVNFEKISSVLSPSFVKSLGELGAKATRQKLKLLNLNYIASHCQQKSYKGPLLPEETTKEWTHNLVASSDDQLSKLMIDSLSNFLPSKKYLELNQQLDCGVFVDAICYCDSNMTPVTLEIAKQISSSSQPIQKIAILVEGYPSICLGLKQSTGHSVLNAKILEAQNYVVITVPFTEFAQSDKLVRRVQYLEQKLKNALPKTETTQSAISSWQ